MPAMEPLSRYFSCPTHALTKEEKMLLEAELFVRICAELKEHFRKAYLDYFRLLKFTIEKEELMLENKLAQLIIKDILSSDEYNLKGIAFYTDTHTEVIEEVLTGRNKNPSSVFLRRLVDLHRSVRRDLYELIIKKIRVDYALT